MSAESDYIRAERDNILRTLEQQGIKIPKTESWHKDVLLTFQKKSIVSQEQFEALRKLLVFRHMQIHGYGYMLDEHRLRELAGPVPKECRDFLSNVL